MSSSGEQILAIERTLQQNNKGSNWNNKTIRWSIVHNFQNQSKPYDIELEMILVSSKRIVKVNQQVKDVQMCSFGYQAKFDISDRLKGIIKQDSLTFQLFVNGKSFTSLQESNKTYQPPKLNIPQSNPWQTNNNKHSALEKRSNPFQINAQMKQKQKQPKIKNITGLKKPESKVIEKPSQNLVKSMQYETPVLKKQPISSGPIPGKKQTQNTIKDTQSELIRILMEEKKRKKEEQRLKQVQNL